MLVESAVIGGFVPRVHSSKAVASSSLPSMRSYLDGSKPFSISSTSSSSRPMTTSVLSSVSRSSFPSLRSRTVRAPASRPAAMSSTLSPTMTTGRLLPDGTLSSSRIPQLRAICQMPSGEGFGGRKSLVTTGSNGARCPGTWWCRKCVTGALPAKPPSQRGPHLRPKRKQHRPRKK